MTPPMRCAALAAALLTAAAWAAPAFAHAFLQAASPKVGARLAGAPAEVRLTFSEPIEPAFSSLTVAGPPGFQGAAAARPDRADPRTLVATLRGPTPAGRYLVRWRVTSVDSHTTQGSFRFEVAP